MGLIMLKVQKRSIRNAVKNMVYENLNSDQITELKFLNSDSTSMTWHDIDEFEYHSQMYDVLSYSVSEDSITYLCFRDQKESLINIKIDLMAANIWGTSPFSKDYESELIDFIKKLNSSQLSHINFGCGYSERYILFGLNYAELKVDLDVDIPPPQFS